MKKFVFIVVMVAFTTINFAQITVDQSFTIEQYVNDILLGSGVTASNVSFTGSEIQIGFMQGGDGTIFPMDEGVVLSCANAMNIDGNGFGEDVPFGEGVSGDQDLLDIANSVPPLINQNFSVSAVNDLAILEFDFVASGDSLQFSYSFGSDEYLEWVNSSFNDIFAFFLSGPGIVGPYAAPAGFPDGAINIAEVPNSDPQLPITISSVNDQINDEYYIDNFANTDIAIDGFTVSLVAEYGGLQCGETYHIKLAIADGSDTALESIVVIEAGSFESNAVAIETGTVNPPELGLNEDEVLEGCSAGFFTVYSPEFNEDVTVLLSLGGTATNGEDYIEIPGEIVIPAGETQAQIELIPLYDELSEGDETVTLFYTYIDGCGDEVTVDAELVIKDYAGMTKEIDDVFLCLGASQTIGGSPSDGQNPFSYSWSSGGGSLNETVDNGDEGEVILTITDFCDSTITASFIVDVADELESHPLQEFYCIGERTAVFPKEGTPPYTFPDVSNIDGLNMTEAGEFYADVPGEWTIEISDDCGESFIHELIFIACDTWIPNVMTPNSDGKNDTFFIDGIAGFAGSQLTIYNRWGNVIYESVNYQNSWDGEDYPDGTYFYTFIRSDGEEFSGHFTILR